MLKEIAVFGKGQGTGKCERVRGRLDFHFFGKRLAG
jgi:hypothetical protein